MNAVRPSLVFLAVGAFLIPMLGGQISLDQMPPATSTITAIFRGPQGALIGWALAGLPFAIAWFMHAMRSRVASTPTKSIMRPLAVLLFLFLISVVISQYRVASLSTFASWTVATGVLLGTVALVGKRGGGEVVLGAFVLGSALVASIGIWEFVTQPDPNWRIFANWFHPNAIAALMALALPVAAALAAGSASGAMVLGGVSTALITVALVLTQSKGGYLAALIGLVVFAIATIGFEGFAAGMKRAVKVVVSFGVAAALAWMVLRPAESPAAPPTQPATPPPAGAPPATEPPKAQPQALTRIANAGSTQEQSAGFRKLLWLSSIDLVKMNPVGWGLNTFRYHSARPGRTTQTVLAHNSYLQLAAEASPFAMIAFLWFGIAVVWQMLRGARKLPKESAAMRAGILGAIFSAAVHNAIDSDLYHFGLLAGLMLIAGVGLQLAADATTPEAANRPNRLLLPGGAAVGIVILLWLGSIDLRLGQAAAMLATGDANQARTAFQSVASSAPWDGRAVYALALMEPDTTKRTQLLEQAGGLLKTTRILRTSARNYEQQGEPGKALDRLYEALMLDPNNLSTLLTVAQVEKESDRGDWKKTIERLLAVENTSVYQIRAIPEAVPTETATGRMMLSATITEPAQRAAVIRAAVDIFVKYATITAPRVLQQHRAIPGSRFAEEDAREAAQKCDEGKAAADELLQLYRGLNDTAGAGYAEAAAQACASAAEALKA